MLELRRMLGGRLRLGRVAGIDVLLHGSFPLFLAVVGAYFAWSVGWREAATTVLSILVLFFLVLLHELGHSLVAQRLGVTIRSITLMPMGGLALMDALPRRPRHEILIAIAGPAVNLILAAVALLLRLLLPLTALWPAAGQGLVGELAERFVYANLALALFNLLPAFPMDGGRILRATLATRMPYLRATERAVRVGRALAALLVLAPFLYPPLLMLGVIGVFLLVAGGRELRGVRLDELLNHRPLSTLLDLDREGWLLAARETPLGDVRAALLQRDDADWVIVDLEGGALALLGRRELLAAAAALPPELPMLRLVERPLRALPADATAAAALRAFGASGLEALPVREGPSLRGVLRAATLRRMVDEIRGGATRG
ncbi:MAG: site-2 protease family protein [Candidatus Latescibacteria bacterium]|nr:site-2 protease family protein [Candidatus Latescibacterota bacterium]